MATQTRTIHQDVKIRAVETVVENGLIRREFFLLGPATVLTPGEQLFVQTRKPWPAHVTVGATVQGNDIPAGIKKLIGDKEIVTKFDFVPRETTKRVAGEMKVTNSDRIQALEVENAKLVAQNTEILSLLQKIAKK